MGEVTTTGRTARGIMTPFAALLLAATLAFPALAAAQSPTDDQYDEISSTAAADPGGTAGADDPSGLGANVGPLPFTGFDVIAMLAVALAVAGVGLVLRRAVAREATDEL